MNHMKVLLIALTLALTSCGILQKIEKAGEFVEQARGKFEAVSARVAQVSAAVKSLDKDQDGEIGWAELLGGLGTLAAGFGLRNSLSTKEKKRAAEAKAS